MGMYRQGLQFLAEGLANGLDGKTAYSFLQDLMAMKRQNQLTRADSSKSLMDLALGLSQQGYAPEDIKSVISQYAPNMPGLGARAEANLIGMAGNLPAVPMTGADAVAGPSLLPDGTEMFDQTDVDAITGEVQRAVLAGNKDLHTFRMEKMTQMRSMGIYNQDTLAYIYRLIGTLWQGTQGVDPNSFTQDQVARIYGSGTNPTGGGGGGGGGGAITGLNPGVGAITPGIPTYTAYNQPGGAVNYGGFGGATPNPIAYGGFAPAVVTPSTPAPSRRWLGIP